MTLSEPLHESLGDKRDEFCTPGEAESFLMGEEGTGEATAHLFLFWALIWKNGFWGLRVAAATSIAPVWVRSELSLRSP